MRFLEDFKQLTHDMKIGITSLISNITTREGSHKGGWARLLKCQLINMGFSNITILDNKNSLNEFDVIIFDLGAEYSGALNMFGGLDEKVFKRLNEIKDFKGFMYSWRNELPSVLALNGRRSNASTCEAFKQTGETFLNEVQESLNKCQVFEHAYRTDGLLIGDSHTPSVWTPAFMIERRDGRTLKGMLEHKTINKYRKMFEIDMGHRLDKLQIHCGSIDIRHHVNRESSPDNLVISMATELINQMMQLSDAQLITTHTMGIEDESRELPKTGYFKGTPYFGTWEQRNRSREIFNAMMDGIVSADHNSMVVSFPKYFFDQSGKLRFEVMEKPQSVHLSPEHYRWDLDKNELRWTEAHDVSMQTKFAVIKMSGDLERSMYIGDT